MYLFQETLSASGIDGEDKDTKGRGVILEKLLDLQALVNSMLLPLITEAEIAETLQEKEVKDKQTIYFQSPIFFLPEPQNLGKVSL